MTQRITVEPSQLCEQSGSLTLSAEQSHYLTRVLRLRAGDRFIAQDGLGNQWLAAIAQRPGSAPGSKAQTISAQVINKLPTADQPSAELRLVAALTKGNSFDAVVRQTTELGVTHIHPVITARSLLKPGNNKMARWQRIAKEASEQSERITVPEVLSPAAFQDCLAQLEQNGHQQNARRSLHFICAARGAHMDTAISAVQSKKSLEIDTLNSSSSLKRENHLLRRLLFHQQSLLTSADLPSIVIAIGPEGGWSADEITLAAAYNYEVVSLGSAVLRAVTAPITALSLVTATRELLI